MVDNRLNSWINDSLPYSDKEYNQCVDLSKRAFSIIMKHYNKIYNDFEYKGKFIIQYERKEESKEESEEETETLEQ